MLRILDPHARNSRLCDGISRRNFLAIGALGAAGVCAGTELSLAQLMAAEANAGVRGSTKSIILVYLVGGPPHQDLFDLKPEAPAEFAGPWRPIRTNVPGIEICELLPGLAKVADKFTIVRSLCDAQGDHDAIQCYTGRTHAGRVPAGGWPQMGSVVAKVQGPTHQAIPPFVSLCYPCTHGPYNEPGPGFLGPALAGFRPLGDTKNDMVLKGVTTDRLADRARVLAALDQFRREVDASRRMKGLDVFTQQALGVLTSSKLAEALDISEEDPKVIARYGTGDPTIFMDENGAPRVPQSFLVARRLVEAGARFVTVNYSKWDWHGGAYDTIFNREKQDFPVFDQGLSALLEDLHDRGLDNDTAVLVWGEFGRTPKISAQVGRDHWPRVACALLAGGGIKTGQIIGSTDRLGGEPTSRPVRFQEVFATLYHHLGLDPRRVTVPDLHGRPQYLVDDGVQPMRELI
ncbi:MAG TPA: DUF1501 domain-containing protein [Pirellulaceae bacterium]|nr:DUF1501 domain-containing protein [Pirellulaceae bacterium]